MPKKRPLIIPNVVVQYPFWTIHPPLHETSHPEFQHTSPREMFNTLYCQLNSPSGDLSRLCSICDRRSLCSANPPAIASVSRFKALSRKRDTVICFPMSRDRFLRRIQRRRRQKDRNDEESLAPPASSHRRRTIVMSQSGRARRVAFPG